MFPTDLAPVILESPFKGGRVQAGPRQIYLSETTNVEYMRACMHDCLVNHRESPYASHGLYTQPGVLRDSIEEPDDLVYLDPPYTKRQYASYYHILETITLNDRPDVEGVCGLRPWRHLASPFCYKRRALGAMLDLVRGLGARRVLISYSSEGHISVPELAEQLEGDFVVEVHEVMEIGRYRPNVAASTNGDSVVEFVVEVRQPPVELGTELPQVSKQMELPL